MYFTHSTISVREVLTHGQQYLRDWLTESGNKAKEGVSLPDEVVKKTTEKYTEAYELLTGKTWA